MNKVLVCGGRDYANRAFVFATLDDIGPAHLVTGDADGADALAREWAQDRCIPYTTYPADWRKHGKKAGPIRNRQMFEAEKPTLVVAFAGGRGTASMVSIATAGGAQVLNFGGPGAS